MGAILSSGGDNHANAEVFSPPYLFKGPRPAVTAAPTSVAYGQAFSIETPDASQISKVTMLRLSSVTHAFNENQRFNSLSFTEVVGGLNVTVPANGNLAPPGDYMMFLINDAGVPSVAKYRPRWRYGRSRGSESSHCRRDLQHAGRSFVARQLEQRDRIPDRAAKGEGGRSV